MTSQRRFVLRALLIWGVLCLIGSIALYAGQLRRQYGQLDNAFSALYDDVNLVLTQNESVLPVLNGDESLSRLANKFPQIAAVEKTVSRPLDAPRVEAIAAGRYWLYNPYRQLRIQIVLPKLTTPGAAFSDIRLDLRPAAASPAGLWQWSRTFSNHYQPFTLRASAGPAWFSVAPLPYLVFYLAAGGAVALGGLLLWLRRQQRGERQRADYYRQARLNTLDEISAGVLHEINQPLTAAEMWIQGAIRQLQHSGDAQKAGQALSAALEQTRRIGELLTRFRAQLVQEEIALTAVRLDESWQRVVHLLEYEAVPHKLTLTHDFAAARVQADRLWLEQVLHNLLTNAIQIQQTSPAGWVHISSRAEGGCVRVTIADGGPGFSPNALRQALMPLYSERRGGLGLGLTLADSLMTKMNGSITLSNRQGGGGEVQLMFIAEA